MQQYTIKTLYAFQILNEYELSLFAQTLVQKAAEKNVIGLVILGKEGFNTTLAGTNEALLIEFITEIKTTLQV